MARLHQAHLPGCAGGLRIVRLKRRFATASPRDRFSADARAQIDQTLPWLYVTGAEAAFKVGRPALADSLLARLERACVRCEHYYRYEAGAALARGDTAIADSLLARARRSAAARHDR